MTTEVNEDAHRRSTQTRSTQTRTQTRSTQHTGTAHTDTDTTHTNKQNAQSILSCDKGDDNQLHAVHSTSLRLT